MPSLAARVTPVEQVARRDIGGQTVAVHLGTGQYHSLNATAGRMLDELLAGPTVGDALDRLATEYDAPRDRLEQDLLELCDALEGRGLVAFVEP